MEPDVTPAVPAAEPPKADPAGGGAAAAPALDTANKDALEIGQLLLDSGIGKEQINDVLNAPQALQSIRYMVENDPQEFIRSLERTNPGAGENFLDKLSKLYVDRYAKPDTSKGDDKGAPVNDELMSTVRELRDKVTGFETAATKAANASAMAQVSARYEARVDDLFGQLPADKFPLSNYEKSLVRKALSADLSSQPDVVQRVHNGNFVDVPKHFKTIVEGIAQDRVAKVNAEKAARDKSAAVALPQFEGAPIELPKDFYDVANVPTDQLWDEGPLVKILEGTK